MGLSRLSASPSLSQSYLAPGSPSPIRPSQVSGFQYLCVSPPPLLSHFAPLRFPRTLYPSPDRLRAPGRPGRPFSWGRGWPPHLAPALPPPSPSARLYKANRPLYSAAPRAGLPRPPYMARRLRSAPGPALGGGGATLGSVSCPSTRPLLQPRGSPRLRFPIPAPHFLPVEPWEKPP